MSISLVGTVSLQPQRSFTHQQISAASTTSIFVEEAIASLLPELNSASGEVVELSVAQGFSPLKPVIVIWLAVPSLLILVPLLRKWV